MKHTTIFITLALLLFIPSSGCKILKSVKRQKSTVAIDSTHNVVVTKESNTLDSVVFNSTLKKVENTELKKVTITESTAEAKTAPFTITASFKIDPTAGGDTIRLVDTEDERSKVEIFYDQKTGQGIARINTKSQIVKLPFRQIDITNASINKHIDSTSFHKSVAVDQSIVDSSSKSTLKKSETLKRLTKDKKSFKLPAVAWVIISLLVVGGVLYLLFNWNFIFRKISSPLNKNK